jgi:ketosteroid isomerase-like protein
MPHPNETMLRRAYACFAQGDLQGYLAHTTPDITFRVPGRGAAAGTFRRDEFIGSMIATVMRETGGTFREDVIDVVASDSRGVVLARHSFTRNGAAWSYNTAHVYRIENGKLASFEEYPEDLYAFDEAWQQ